MQKRLPQIREWLFEPVSVLPLVYMRIAFGVIMMWEVTRYYRFGWIERYYMEPVTFFTYYGFQWLRPLPGEWMYAVWALLGVLAFCITVGLAYRFATTLFFLTFTYIFLLDQSNYLNHFYLISLVSFLMIFLPAHRAFSYDAWVQPGIRATHVSAWSLYWLRFQLGVAYFFGGVAKLNGDWLRGEPMRMWLSSRTDFPVIGAYFTEEWMVYAFSYGGLLLDLLAVPLLLWRRTRWFTVVLVVGFHLMNDNLFSIGIFPWFMIAVTPLFFPPEWFRLPSWGADMPEFAPPTLQRQGVVLGLLAAYCAFQVVYPLRHYLYPGDVNWTEEGHMFAWHMKLRDKRGDAQFVVYDRATGARWSVDPAHHLTRRQLGELEKPQAVLMFSHYLADLWVQRGVSKEVEVYAEVYVSMNGRPSQLLIDPCVNLAAERRSPLRNAWVMPLQVAGAEVVSTSDTPPNLSPPCTNH